MTMIEICKLVDKSENEFVCGKYKQYLCTEKHNNAFDYSGVMPVYILNANFNNESFIEFDVMQPSGNIVTFTIPYEFESINRILPTGRHYSLSIGRYAEIIIKENKSDFFVEKIELINDEKMIKIIEEVNRDYSF